MKVDLKNNDAETILLGSGGIRDISIFKSGTAITLQIGASSVSVPFELGVNDIYVYSPDGATHTLVVGENSDTVITLPQGLHNFGFISPTKDFEGIIYELLLDDGIITSPDVSNVINPKILLKDFQSRYTLSNNGTIVFDDESIDDCILWGDAGNAVFSFDTLVPISEIRWFDDGKPYQMFGLGINCLISEDIIYGNNYEYFLDGEQIFPIDRQHSYSAQGDLVQYIMGNFAKQINEENAKDLSHTFFYKPKKNLTELAKQLTGNTEEQNKSYTLLVQFPFYKETYEVLIDSGGLSGNINELSTLTITYKQKDDALS